MILEHALLRVSIGAAENFEASMARALPIIESAPGCHGGELRRQVEDPSIFLLLVRWESVEAHLAFRASDLFESWRTLTHPWYVEAPSVTHFAEAIERP
ncbi:MAG TPA: antibiotic biosynthesis monooxygenase family protein [Acidimicrobiales bacterium]|nr:antibiotic biosynthesis monooxygenase family protein [Acidimicrobiales bacterium]